MDFRQKEINRRLELLGTGPATYFVDACKIMEDAPQFASSVHLVSHLLREIESSLRAVLLPLSDQRTLDWEDKTQSEADRKHKEVIKAILAALEISETEEYAVSWMNMSANLHRFAHRKGLQAPRPMTDGFIDLWDSFLSVFEHVLEIFERKYSRILRTIDELVTNPSPTVRDAKSIKNSIPNNPHTMEYFFNKLDKPRWLQPLKSEGVFSLSLDLIKDLFSGSHTEQWPAARYLKKMAPEAPRQVLRIISELPETDNVIVHEDLADIALAMPPDLASEWTPREERWIYNQSDLLWRLPGKYKDLVLKLLQSGRVDSAFTLAQALLSLHVTSPGNDGVSSKEQLRYVREPQARFDDWKYKKILNELASKLIQFVGVRGLELFVGLLNEAVGLFLSSEDRDVQGTEDSSHIWRPAVEEHEQNSMPDLKSTLAMVVRDGAEKLIATDGDTVLEIIENRHYVIFKRIGLYLRRKYPDLDPVGTIAKILDRGICGEISPHHEYFHLVRERFPLLTDESQNQYLDLVSRKSEEYGARIANLHQEKTGEDLDSTERARLVRNWQYFVLEPVHDHLKGEWINRFEVSRQKFGKLSHPDFHYFSLPSWVGPTSPKSIQDLNNMHVDEIIDYLRTWDAPSGEYVDTHEGLGRMLEGVVEGRPLEFADKAEEFKELEPVYVRQMFSGLDAASRQGKQFNWQSVLGLCQWVIQQEDPPTPEGFEPLTLDPNWSWTRKATASLLQAGLEAGANGISTEYREIIWKILEPLTNDPDPKPEDEDWYGEDKSDPAFYSINTTRGQAMHALIHYGLWVRRDNDKTPDKEKLARQGFDVMNEVREVLDRHLDPDIDSSLTVRSVYGQKFPWLALLDEKWSEKNVKKIFPFAEELRRFFAVAWDSYILSCPPYDSVLGLLTNQYRSAIESLSCGPQAERVLEYGKSWGDSECKLARHLMMFYWREKLDIDDQEGLLPLFFEKADDALRAEAIEYIGRRLIERARLDEERILARSIALWEWRLGIMRGSTGQTQHQQELAAFGWWFASKKFDGEWSLSQLQTVLRLTSGKVDHDFEVIRCLAEMVEDVPCEVLESTSILIEKDEEKWRPHHWRSELRRILSASLMNKDTREKSKGLVNLLLARGHFDYRDLLK